MPSNKRNVSYRRWIRGVSLFLFFLFCLKHNGYAQIAPVKILNKMFNDTSSGSKPKWIGYPILGYAPETAWEIGAAAVLVFYAKQDTSNRLSEVSGFSFFTLEGQYGTHFEHAIYSNKNKWFALGKLKFQSYPLHYYGIGPSISGESLGLAHANYSLIRERALRKIKGSLYLGLELDYVNLSNVRFEWKNGVQQTESILGEDGFSNLGLGLGIVYDTRHNVLNVRNGYLAELGFLTYQPVWSSTNKLNTLFIDNRAYFKITKRNVLAFQTLGQFSKGEVPFNQLSMIGGEMMMRGYYLGKYRDKNMLCFQAEHRWLPFPFSKRFGGAVFASIGSVSPNLNFDKLLPSAGGGVRFLIFPKRDVFTRFDVGVNPEGYGFYFFIGEAF